MFSKKSFALAVVGLAFVGLATAQNDSIAQVLATNSQTTRFYSKINGTSILSLLQGNNSNATYTVFAPSDSAFTPQVMALLPTVSDLHDLLLYHIVNGTHTSSSFQDGTNIVDSVVNNGSLLKWSNASGLAIDVEKSPSPTSSGASPSATPDTGITLFYGIGSANVTQVDIQASNGVIHIIDSIMSLPQPPSVTAEDSVLYSQNLIAFYQAINQTGLQSTIDGANGVTIFAPSDAAFAKANLSGLSNDTLVKIMKYHIVNEVLYSTNITTNFTTPTNVTTAEGDNVTIAASGNDITVGNYNTTGKVITANIITDNGVMHIIDTVLFPINVTNSTNSTSGASSVAFTSVASSPVMLLSLVVALASLML